jgi:hypothetical protein
MNFEKKIESQTSDGPWGNRPEEVQGFVQLRLFGAGEEKTDAQTLTGRS